MEKFLAQLKLIWPLVMTAPWAFATLFAATLAFGWAVGRFMYRENIETLKSRIAARDERIAELLAKLDTAPAQAAAADPDGIYQRGQKVGSVVRAHVDLSASTATFDQLLGDDKFNPGELFRYRDANLLIVKVGSSGSAKIAGRKSIKLSTVTCRVL